MCRLSARLWEETTYALGVVHSRPGKGRDFRGIMNHATYADNGVKMV